MGHKRACSYFAGCVGLAAALAAPGLAQQQPALGPQTQESTQPSTQPAPLFTPAERAALVAFWTAPGRMTVAPCPWCVRLTVPGSLWFWKYQMAIGAAKAPPTEQPTAAPAAAAWKTWVDGKLAYDRYTASLVALSANQPPAGGLGDGVGHGDPALPSAPPPGPIPPDLQAACGDPPGFAAAVAPLKTTITFGPGESYTYIDHVRVPPAYAYYRFSNGVISGGSPMSPTDLAALFATAGLAPSEQRVMMAVSRLEGQFDAVNTYDTGFVSIGFIQFITRADGHGVLLKVLQQEKTTDPQAFQADFHQYGIDVTPDGTLDVVDPETGAELTGADAVQRTISDVRLTAVWQRAGLHSAPFRIAQIQEAKSLFWPMDDPVTVTVNGTSLTGKVSDVIHSEAGMATLFDRSVNRGSIAPFPAVLQKVMQQRNLTAIPQAAQYEQEIVLACKYRADYLKDSTLSQPPTAPAQPAGATQGAESPSP